MIYNDSKKWKIQLNLKEAAFNGVCQIPLVAKKEFQGKTTPKDETFL